MEEIELGLFEKTRAKRSGEPKDYRKQVLDNAAK